LLTTRIDPSIEFPVRGRNQRLLGIVIDKSYDIEGIDEGLRLARAFVDAQTKCARPPPKVPN
jgi:hypothetical protein